MVLMLNQQEVLLEEEVEEGVHLSEEMVLLEIMAQVLLEEILTQAQVLLLHLLEEMETQAAEEAQVLLEVKGMKEEEVVVVEQMEQVENLHGVEVEAAEAGMVIVMDTLEVLVFLEVQVEQKVQVKVLEQMEVSHQEEVQEGVPCGTVGLLHTQEGLGQEDSAE